MHQILFLIYTKAEVARKRKRGGGRRPERRENLEDFLANSYQKDDFVYHSLDLSDDEVERVTRFSWICRFRSGGFCMKSVEAN